MAESAGERLEVRWCGQGLPDSRVDVIDCVPHRLQVLEIFVVDVKSDRALRELFLERLDQLDERQ